MRPSDPERGAGTVLVLGLVAVAGVLAATLALVGQGLLAGARVRTAADLAALAGATVVAVPAGLTVTDPRAEDLACAAAADAAGRNRAEVVACRLTGPVLAVTVAAPGPWGEVRAGARAGPASARPRAVGADDSAGHQPRISTASSRPGSAGAATGRA